MLLGFYVLKSDLIGGWSGLTASIATLEDRYTSVPGLIHFGLGTGGWTAVMILTYMFALMVKFLPGPVLGIVFLGAIAAIHSTAAPYIGNSAITFCGFPAIWSWQILWWIVGIVMM